MYHDNKKDKEILFASSTASVSASEKTVRARNGIYQIQIAIKRKALPSLARARPLRA